MTDTPDFVFAKIPLILFQFSKLGLDLLRNYFQTSTRESMSFKALKDLSYHERLLLDELRELESPDEVFYTEEEQEKIENEKQKKISKL